MKKIFPYIITVTLMAIALYFKFNFIAVVGSILGIGTITASCYDFFRTQKMKKIAAINNPEEEFKEKLNSDNNLSKELKEDLLKQFNLNSNSHRELEQLRAQFKSQAFHSEYKSFIIFIAGIIILSISIYFL